MNERNRSVFAKDSPSRRTDGPGRVTDDLDTPQLVRGSRKRKTKRLEKVRSYGCDRTLCQYYRRTTVQIVTKSITSVPFLVLWTLWMAGVLRQEDNWEMIIYNLILSGSIITYPWLMMGCLFNLALMLQVWSMFSIMWSVLCLVSGVQLYLEDRLASTVFLLFGTMCLIDGLLSNGLRFPSFPGESEESSDVSEPMGIPVYQAPGEGPFFFYVPLDGGGPEPITDPLPDYPSWHSDLVDLEEQERLYWESKEGTSREVDVVDRRSSLSEELFWQQLIAWQERDEKK